jgi:lipopolysaccharide/colanic/teichoic acid biosynthesis glycosyltransferase
MQSPHLKNIILEFPAYRPRRTRIWTRGVDLVLATSVFLFVLPLLVLICLAITCESRGPVIERQEAIGRFGRRFPLLRFRTVEVQSTGSSRRATPMGRLLRKTRTDALPQLINVIRGNISLIGRGSMHPFLD